MSAGFVLFRRFPRLVGRPAISAEIVPAGERASYPELMADFNTLDQELVPRFQELDAAALDQQNQFRGTQVTFIFGGLLATALGAVQAAYTELSWPGIAEAVLAGLLAAVAWRGAQIKAQEGYLGSRLKAERLRSEYFLFLGRVGPYTADSDRLRNLRGRIADIVSGDQEAKP